MIDPDGNPHETPSAAGDAAASDRPNAVPRARFDVLFEHPAEPRSGLRGGPLPAELAARYGPRLEIPLRGDRPTVVVNAVASLDGIVSLGGAIGSGAEISGSSEPDRFVMGLLRSLADAIVVGAGTVRAAPRHDWTARRVNRSHAAAYAALRRATGLPPQPTTIVVTAGGALDPAHPALGAPDVPAVVLATPGAMERLRARRFAPHVRVRVIDPNALDEGRITSTAIVEALRDEKVRLALCEGGPRLLGTLLRGNVIDELFLTLAPQLLGRTDTDGRSSLVEGFARAPGVPAWGRLLSVRQAGDHLFLRYAFGTGDRQGPAPTAPGAEPAGSGSDRRTG